MKRILIFLLLLTGTAYGQSFAPEDSCFANAVSLITYNSARINTNTSNGDVSGTTVILNYVRYGHTDTVRSSTPWPNGLRNLTGLASNTVYVYYYAFSNGSEYIPQSVAYYFTTLPNYITYTPMTAAGYQFKYGKFDSGLAIPRGDTTLERSPAIPSIKYKNSDNTYYAYHTDCSCWQPLAIDSSGIITLLDGKVDSVTVYGDSLFYWKLGVGYGYIMPAADKVDSVTVSGDSICYWKGGVSVCEVLPVTTVTASNGLTKSVSDIKLGGTLTGNTDIDGDNNEFVLENTNNTVLQSNSGVTLTAGIPRQSYISISQDSIVLKSNGLDFQKILPYVGTDTGYIGYIINSNYVTTPSAFATQITAAGGASSTAVAGGRQLSVGATNFSQIFYIPNVWPGGSGLPTETYRAVGIKTAANNGLVLAQEVATIAITYWARVWAEYDFNTRVITIKLLNNIGTTTLATSSAMAAGSTGDSIACVYSWDYNTVSATMTNLNTAATTTVSTGFSAPNYPATIYLPCIFFPLTTNPTVLQSLQVYIQAYKNPDFTFVGHSVLQGYAGVTRAETIPEVLRVAMPNYKLQVDAIGSMKIADVQFWMNEIIRKVNGEYVCFMMGANDSGTSDASFYGGYRADRDSFVVNGKKVIHFGQLPQTGFDFTARNDSLKTLYESLGDIFIDIFPLLKNGSGYDYDPAYYLDGIHPNAAGNIVVANEFLRVMSGILGRPVNSNYVNFSQLLNLEKVASYETQQAFNSDRDIPDKAYVDSVASSGGVSSVAATGANGIVVGGSPITGAGTLAFSLGTITPAGIENATGSTSVPSYSFSGNNTVGFMIASTACTGSLNAVRVVANGAGCSPFQIQNLNAGGVSGIDFYNNTANLTAQLGMNNGDNGLYYTNVGSGGTHKFYIGSTERFKIANSGALTASFYGAGAATFDASGNITSVSDERLKNIQSYYKSGLKELMNIKPITYKWNKLSGNEMDSTYAGFSAQNVKANIPLGTGINKDGYLSLQDRAILATLVNAVKEQQVEIERLKAEIKKLKK